MSKNEVPFNEATHWNLYIATGFAVVILCFFRLPIPLFTHPLYVVAIAKCEQLTASCTH